MNDSTITYKGYTAIIQFSSEDDCLVGHIAGINDVIGFHGVSVAEIRRAFTEAVDFYLETCKKSGHQPNKPYSGRVTLRLSPELHAKLAVKAEADGKSLNTFLVATLNQAVS